MALVFDDHVEQIATKSPIIFGLDFSNDGALLAVAVATAAGSSAVRVYDTRDGNLVAEYGAGMLAGRGVAFVGGTAYLHYLLQQEVGGTLLLRAALPDGAPEEIARYGGAENLHGLARNRGGGLLAVLGNAAEVWDTTRREVIRFREGAEPDGAVRACFAAEAPEIFLYGTEPGVVVRLDLGLNQETGRWPAPRLLGQQVMVSASGTYMAAVGQGMTGVFVYDLTRNERYRPQFYNERTPAIPFLFCNDSPLLITREAQLTGERLPSGELTLGPRIPPGRTGAVTGAWEAPAVAFAVGGTVYCARLAEEAGRAKGDRA